MNKTDSFSLACLVYSETAERDAINNTPPPELLPHLLRLAEGLYAVQALLGQPLEVSSAYRCPELNQRVGGVPTSQHTLGQAADFVCPRFGTPREVATAIAASDIQFDQLIHEFGRWVHISFSSQPRHAAMTICSSIEGYKDGISDCDNILLA